MRPASDTRSDPPIDWQAQSVCGVDEVGRGPLAGPVVAAAVILRFNAPSDLVSALADSKALNRRERERLAPLILANAEVGLSAASSREIDCMNILQASLLAMRRAVMRLPTPPGAAIIDGRHTPDLPCPARALVGGDGFDPRISAASIVAKVARDRLMAGLARRYPGYGWERNAGYGTAEHRATLARLGVTPHHRRSFAPIREQLSIAL